MSTISEKEASKTAPGGTLVGKNNEITDNASGGFAVGRSHKENGIKAINKATGQHIEFEGGEVIITKPAVEDNELREFEGEMLNNRQILSKINESGGGVSFAEKGLELPTELYCSGKTYKYGGETLTDYEITQKISKCGCKHDEETFADGGELQTLDNLSIQRKVDDVEFQLIKLVLPIFEKLKVYDIINLSEKIASYDKKQRDSSTTAEAIQYLTQDFSTFDRNDEFNKKHIERLEAFDIIPKLDNDNKSSNNEIMELVISPDNNLSKQLVEQTGDYWNAHDFANIDESITDLSFMKPFYHKETGKKFVVIDPSMQPKAEIKTEPSFQPGDKVIFTPKFGGEFVVNYRGDYYGNAIIADKSFGQMEVQYSQLRKDKDKEVSNGSEFEEVGGNYQFKNKFGSFTSVKVMPVDASLKPSKEYFSLQITVRKVTSNNRLILQTKPLITMPIKDYKTYMTDLKNRVNQGSANFEKADEIDEGFQEEIVETNSPKYKVGDYVSYKTGDIETETWVGIVKEVKDFGNEYAYRLDAYTTDVDPPMFDSEKTNETYEASLKPSKKETFEDAQESYRRWKNKLIKKSDLRLTGAIGKNVVQNKSVIFNNENYQDIAFIYPNGKIEYLVNDLPEEVIKYIESLPTPLEAENTNKTYQLSDYKNPYEVNRAIEALINSKEKDFTPNEIEFISNYSGYGGLEKQGSFSDEELKGLLYEYFTPDAVVKKMWALAYKYGFGTFTNPHILEPSVGTGNFFKYAPTDAELFGNEINNYSKRVCEILYPKAMITLQPFEKNFISKNNSIKGKLNDVHKYHLVIGNPPYGRAVSKYLAMGESDYTKATSFTEYFITRGLDLLHPGGLLIFVVGAEQYNGGTLFLDSGISVVKKNIFDKAQLVDAYRLPTKIFERTGVASEILVFKKK